MVLIENEEYKELVIKANKYDEMKGKEYLEENKQNKDEEIEISVHKCTKKEMAEVLNNLKNKILGEDK